MGPQSYSHMELRSAKNLNDLTSIFKLRASLKKKKNVALSDKLISDL